MSDRTVIQAKLDGPLYIKGHLEIGTGEGNPPQICEEAWLCRCGASSKKPFCDGTHKRNGFSAPAA